MNTRAHVAVLALVEPDAFAARLVVLDASRLRWALPVFEPPSKAGVDRTARYLLDLRERIRLYMEDEAVKKANDDRKDEERRHREDMALTERLIDEDGDVLATIA